MGIKVNNNTGSVQAQRQIALNRLLLKRSFNRLSSGLRINSAADDAAGLAISERFGSQLRGINQGIRNANDGISMTQTADAGLSSVSDGLQRIRELSVQAANGTLTDSDRGFIQDEIDQIRDQIGAVSERTTFNGRSLLSGGESVRIQAGANADEGVDIRLGDVRTDQLGAAPEATSGQIIAGGISAGDLSINAVDIRATQASDDTVSTAQADGSAISVAAAINDSTEFTGVSASVNQTEVSGAAVGGGGLDSNNQLIINDTAIVGLNVESDDAGGSLVDAINAQSDQTGVTASRNAEGGVDLSASDGRNIAIQTTGNAAAVTGLSDGVTTGTVTLSSAEQFEIAGADPNQAGLASGRVGESRASSVSEIDVRTQDGANRAIEAVDRALEEVSSQRSRFGATQNRLESTVSNLSNVSVNISESNSRIRDADIAKEASLLMLAQIKERAGIAVLAQSNKLSRSSAISLLGAS